MVHFPEAGSRPFRFRRSVLFMPASNSRAIEKAGSLPVDTVILDLEDAVAEDDRPVAHSNLRALSRASLGARETVVRITAPASPSHEADLDAALAASPDAILLPKVETAGEIAALAGRIGGQGPAIWAMIETPRALLDLGRVCAAHGKLECLVVGPNDLARSTGARMLPGRAVMVPWLMQILAAGRAHGLAVLDGVWNRFRDLEGFEAECLQGRDMGFDGKTLIHPSQIEIANRAFGPDEAELARARRIIAAFAQPDNAARGAIQIDGEMIERLHLEMAERLVRLAGSM